MLVRHVCHSEVGVRLDMEPGMKYVYRSLVGVAPEADAAIRRPAPGSVPGRDPLQPR